MSINSIENATKYSNELDRMFTQKSATGFFADNALSTKFVGAKTVIIPDIDFQGLADYDRDNGFERGAITVANTSYTMTMDRARSLQIDREDMTETGVANLAGKILGEYVRTKVVPECDAYVLSKLGNIALQHGNAYEGDISSAMEALATLIYQVRTVVGFDEELVAFINSYTYSQLISSDDIAKSVNIADFKQGDINLTVRTLNGVALIPVVSERMKTDYNFNANGIGGFTPKDTAREIQMMVLPKRAAHLVKKTENMRIFTPEQNLDADAYKFDYRIYYDVFVNKSSKDAIWAWVSSELKITSQPQDITITDSNTDEILSVSAECEGELYYQWYSCENENGSYPVKVPMANDSQFTLPENLEPGKYYYFVKIMQNNGSSFNSRVVTVTVV